MPPIIRYFEIALISTVEPRPIHGAPGDCHPLVQGQEVFKSEHHDPLSKEAGVPFDEPNLPSIQVSLILVGTQNERELRPNRSSATQLSLNLRARGEVELLNLLSRPFLPALDLNGQQVLRPTPRCQYQNNHRKS